MNMPKVRNCDECGEVFDCYHMIEIGELLVCEDCYNDYI